MIPVRNSHISKVPSLVRWCFQFTICRWTMLIFSSQLLSEQFSAPFHFPILQQRLLLSLMKCRWWTSSFPFYQRWYKQVSHRDKTNWAHGHQETNHRDDSSTWHGHKMSTGFKENCCLSSQEVRHTENFKELLHTVQIRNYTILTTAV